MAAFNPVLITKPQLHLRAKDAQAEPMPAPAMAPAPVPPVVPIEKTVPVFVPAPVVIQSPKPRPMQVSAEVARKAQSIYPAEQQAKQAMIENAKAPPAPLGAWGKPK